MRYCNAHVHSFSCPRRNFKERERAPPHARAATNTRTRACACIYYVTARPKSSPAHFCLLQPTTTRWPGVSSSVCFCHCSFPHSVEEVSLDTNLQWFQCIQCVLQISPQFATTSPRAETLEETDLRTKPAGNTTNQSTRPYCGTACSRALTARISSGLSHSVLPNPPSIIYP